ncbi:MAG: purine phosphorylase [Rhodospirillales bacterium]
MAIPTLGIVTGLKTEAQLLRGLEADGDTRVALSGADSGRAEASAEKLVAKGADALISFGVCGALQPGLQAGALLLPTSIRAWADGPEGPEVPVTEAWRRRLLDALPARLREELREGSLLGADRVITLAEEKRALGLSFAAAAVDMESHAVAKVAARHGLPLLVVRACSDPADQDLPAGTEQATRPDGSLRLAPVLLGLARRPGSLPGLLRLGRGTQRALATLRQVVALPALREP